MTHKVIKIDTYIGPELEETLEDAKYAIRQALKEVFAKKNISFEITVEDATMKDLEEEMKKYTNIPIPNQTWPNSVKFPTEVGDTPDSWKNQPTCK